MSWDRSQASRWPPPRGREKDTLLSCSICGEEDWINFETRLGEWPVCCEKEMEIVESIESIVTAEIEHDELLRKPKVRIRSKYSEKRYIP